MVNKRKPSGASSLDLEHDQLSYSEYIARDGEKRPANAQSNWTLASSFLILAISILVVVAALYANLNVESLLGNWRTGIVLLIGSAALLGHTLLFERMMARRSRSKMLHFMIADDLRDLEKMRAGLVKQIENEGAGATKAQHPRNISEDKSR